MPNRKIVTSPESGKVQIYGSNTRIPVQVDEHGDLIVAVTSMPGVSIINDITIGAVNVSIPVELGSDAVISVSGTPTVLIDQPVEVTGSVELTGDPTVSISGLTIVDGALLVEVTGVSVVDGAIAITGVMDIDPNATVSISGTPTVLIEQPIEVTGAVELTGDPTISISGLTLVDGALPVQISSMPEVTIANSITVGAVDVTVPVEVVARSTTTDVTILENLAAGITILTPGYNVSQLTDFSFFFVADTEDVNVEIYSYPTIDTQAFATKSSPTNALIENLDSNYYTGILTSNFYSDYSMAAIVALTGTANVTVYFHGIY